MVGTPTYRAWSGMLSRVRYAGQAKYPQYRWYVGITVAPEWDPQQGGDFTAFLEDMGVKPEGTSLDRIDGEKGYEPGNCRWATPAEQCNNRKSNTFVEYNGRQVTLAQAAREAGIHKDTLTLRHSKGDRGDRLFRPTELCGRNSERYGGEKPSCVDSSHAP